MIDALNTMNSKEEPGLTPAQVLNIINTSNNLVTHLSTDYLSYSRKVYNKATHLLLLIIVIMTWCICYIFV